MNLHKNARLSPHSRALLVQRIQNGLSPAEAARAVGVSARTAYKWLKRFRQEGIEGLRDRSSRPPRSPHATPADLRTQALELRRSRRTYRQIGQVLGLSMTTVARLCRRAGLHRLAALEPAQPVVRYEYAQAGGLLHLDIKKLGRFRQPGHRVTRDRRLASDGAGWEYVHVAIDDASRVAFAAVYPDERAPSACTALLQALRYYRGLGVTVQRVMTDNGPAYLSGRFARLLRRLRIRHVRTKPYTPRTNGKAERFIQTALREWAYARAYETSSQRELHLPYWLHDYNWHRPHASLNYQPPISRVPLAVNNLLALHS
jgi:transposase InsO family protein